MKMTCPMNRREYLLSAGAVTLLSGCRSVDLFGAPEWDILCGKPDLGKVHESL